MTFQEGLQKFIDGYAVISLQENSLLFRDHINLGHGFVKAQKIAPSDKTAQISYSAGRVNFSGVWGLFYNRELILPELYQSIVAEPGKIIFKSNFSEEQLDGNPKSGYITFDGVIH